MNETDMKKENGCDAAKNDEKFDAIYQEMSGRIFAYALGMLGDHDSACEIVSETFYKAALEPDFTNDDFKYRPWLFKVATNVMRNIFRRFFNRFLRFSNQMLDSYADKSDVSRKAEKNEELEELSRALSKLDEKDREVVYLKYYEEMDYSAISHVTGVPVGTVASRLSRAIGRLSYELGKK